MSVQVGGWVAESVRAEAVASVVVAVEQDAVYVPTSATTWRHLLTVTPSDAVDFRNNLLAAVVAGWILSRSVAKPPADNHDQPVPQNPVAPHAAPPAPPAPPMQASHSSKAEPASGTQTKASKDKQAGGHAGSKGRPAAAKRVAKAKRRG